MVPLLSEAVAVMGMFEPAVTLLPLVGFVIATIGTDWLLTGAVTVTVIGLDVTETPLVSVATAVMELLPAGKLVAIKPYGGVAAVPKRLVPL
jgi:hypothetical protein